MHISYIEVLPDGLANVKYAEFDGEQWDITIVDQLSDFNSRDARNSTSLELDVNGNPHIAFCDRSKVAYAYRSDDEWVVENVVEASGKQGELGQLVSLDLDSEGRAHVAYYFVLSVSPLSGEIVYARRESAAAVHVEQLDHPGAEIGFDVFPSPMTESASVAYSLAEPTEVEIRIVDLSGRVVRSTFLGTRPAGAGTARLPATGLAAGVYFVSLRTAEYQVNRSLVVGR